MVIYSADICLPIALVSIVFPLKVLGRVRGLPSPPMVVTRALSIRILESQIGGRYSTGDQYSVSERLNQELF